MYAREVTAKKFRLFARDKATLSHLSSDIATMRLFMGGQRAVTKDIYARTLKAKSPDGDSCEILPELSRPQDSKTSGLAASIPIKDLFVDELMGSRTGFRFLTISFDGVDTTAQRQDPAGKGDPPKFGAVDLVPPVGAL